MITGMTATTTKTTNPLQPPLLVRGVTCSRDFWLLLPARFPAYAAAPVAALLLLKLLLSLLLLPLQLRL